MRRVLALPCWKGAAVAEPLTGGLSNEIWKVTDDAGSHVVRFGVDYPFHHVNRARELMVTRAAHAAGFGPAVEYSAPGVMVTAFLQARTWGAEDLRTDPERVSNFLRKFHRKMPLVVSGEAVLFWVFHVVRDYARILAGSTHCSDLEKFLKMSVALEAVQVPLPIIFAHNDLLPANIMEDRRRLWLIDYEYAGFSTALFDLAGAASNARMDDEQALTLLESYFGAPADSNLLRAFAAMQCASLLRETMWAMVSQLHLETPGVDYAGYIKDNRAALEAQIAAYETQYGKLVP